MYLWTFDTWQSWQWKSVGKYWHIDFCLTICIYLFMSYSKISLSVLQIEIWVETKNQFIREHFPYPWISLTCNFHWTVIFPRSGESDLSPDRKRIFSLITDRITALCWDEDQVSWQQSSQTYMKNYSEKHACSSNRSHIHLLKQNCRAALHWTANA